MVYDSGKFNITLKKVIRRIEGLDNDSKVVWTREILSELGSDAITKAYKDGHEQGKFEEALQYSTPQAEIPDYIAHWIDYCNLTNVDFVRSFLVDKYCLYNYARQSDLPKIKEWFKSSRNRITFIDAWENGYTIKETYYYVAIPVGKGMYNRLAVNCSGEVLWISSLSTQDSLCNNLQKTRLRSLLYHGLGNLLNNWRTDCDSCL